MDNLITITDIQEFKPISKNTDATKKVDPFVHEAQEFEIRPFLSDEFYIQVRDEVLASPPLQNQKIKDLWLGSQYICGTNTFENPGLKVVLVYYAYARIINRAPSSVTAYGVRTKSNPNSEPLSEKAIARLVGQAVSGAKAYEIRVRDFLVRNSLDYPLFDCGEDNRKAGNIRITPVGGNSNRRRRIYDPRTDTYYYR